MKYIILVLLFMLVVGVYYGNDYKVDKIKLNNSKNYFITTGITAIYFSNSVCVGRWGGYCNVGKIEYLGKSIKITIGQFNNLTDYQIKWLYNHEYYHYLEYVKSDYNTYIKLNETLADEWADKVTE
jgi:hypothetical protein